MGMLSIYSKYFLTEKEMTELYKKEIFYAFRNVNYDISKLPNYQQAWVKFYFSDIFICK